jgi:hypothetical protein
MDQIFYYLNITFLSGMKAVLCEMSSVLLCVCMCVCVCVWSYNEIKKSGFLILLLLWEPA